VTIVDGADGDAVEALWTPSVSVASPTTARMRVTRRPSPAKRVDSDMQREATESAFPRPSFLLPAIDRERTQR
jgi:hypothetical protein